jgi:hypothetical protein
MRIPLIFTSLILLKFQVAVLAQDAETESGPWPELKKPDVSDATSLKIIGLHLKARGGEANLARISSIRTSGELMEGQQDYRIESIHKSPDALILKSTRTHMGDDYVAVTATDGRVAWRQELTPKRKNPTPLSSNDRLAIETDAMLPFLFLEAVRSGHTFASRGEEKYGGNKTYVLHVWLKNGQEIEAMFDATSFHVINYRQSYRIGSRDTIVDRTPVGMNKIDGTWWDSGYDYRIMGKTFRKVRYKSISPTAAPKPDAFQQPPSRERWLKKAS